MESSQPVEGSDWQLRDKYNAVVSPADLQQSFLPAFKAGVAAGVRSMMTSYHALNGIPATAHPIIQSELRERLGWEGMIMSDGGAVAFMLNFAYLNLSLTDNITGDTFTKTDGFHTRNDEFHTKIDGFHASQRRQRRH